MKKANRIKDNEDFKKVIKTGKFSKNQTYRVYWLENTLGYVRVGIAASKKLGNAVIRSTTRRKIRAICDDLIDYQTYSLDIVIMPKDLFLEQNHQINKAELENNLTKFIRIKQ